MIIKPTHIAAGLAVVAALAYVLVKKNNGIAGAGAAVAGAAFDFVDSAAGTVVQSAAAVVGVPKTNMTECERAMAEGRTWDASFACPAGTFIKYMVN